MTTNCVHSVYNRNNYSYNSVFVLKFTVLEMFVPLYSLFNLKTPGYAYYIREERKRLTEIMPINRLWRLAEEKML